MSSKKVIIIAVIALAIVFAAGIFTSYRTALDENGKPITSNSNDISTNYVDDHWEVIMSEIDGNAVDLMLLLEESGGDFAQVQNQYATGSGPAFTVSGRGEITEVDTQSRAGTLTFVPEGYTGDKVFVMQIGPIFRGNALRDSLTSVRFSDFDNQMDWSRVSTQIMEKVTEGYLADVDFSASTGKQIRFVGCFPVDSTGEVTIQPASIYLD